MRQITHLKTVLTPRPPPLRNLSFCYFFNILAHFLIDSFSVFCTLYSTFRLNGDISISFNKFAFFQYWNRFETGLVPPFLLFLDFSGNVVPVCRQGRSTYETMWHWRKDNWTIIWLERLFSERTIFGISKLFYNSQKRLQISFI